MFWNPNCWWDCEWELGNVYECKYGREEVVRGREVQVWNNVVLKVKKSNNMEDLYYQGNKSEANIQTWKYGRLSNRRGKSRDDTQTKHRQRQGIFRQEGRRTGENNQRPGLITRHRWKSWGNKRGGKNCNRKSNTEDTTRDGTIKIKQKTSSSSS